MKEGKADGARIALEDNKCIKMIVGSLECVPIYLIFSKMQVSLM
jgi:hypothetical protein